MAYNAVSQQDHDQDLDCDDDVPSLSAAPKQQRGKLASPILTPLEARAGLFLDNADNKNTRSHDSFIQQPTGTGFVSSIVQSISARGTNAKLNNNYDLVEDDDFTQDARRSPVLPSPRQHPTSVSTVPLHVPRARRRSPTTAEVAAKTLPRPTRSPPSQPVVRTASGRSLALRHPTPDLQVLQGAYVGNIEHLDRMAEQLSLTSSIDVAIKRLHDEQKLSDSRRSSLLSSQGMAAITRQVSNASSIVEVNSTARSGGYSPAGYVMPSGGSFSGGATGNNGRGRSASKSSRFGSRPEPEMEGRPLDSFVNIQSMHSSSSLSPKSPDLARTTSIEEQEEKNSTLTKAVLDLLGSPIMDESSPKLSDEQPRPDTSASTVYSNPEALFEGFDGTHAAPSLLPTPSLQESVVSGNESVSLEDNPQPRRLSSGNQLSMARPQSYADPGTGQQMVYYPAPVPMMLNLPQKLSKLPSSMARNQRRSQVISGVPEAARQSAIWLPDVLEDEDGRSLQEEDEANGQEYMAQHQRASMGGRRLTQDLSHMPPQLRASAFFDLPAPNEVVELKDQSAVATLDSILDASAFAPVSAFTDHAFAGHLGNEVYGKSHVRNNRSSTQLLEAPPNKKRNSSLNLLLRGRRASNYEAEALDKEHRRASVTGLTESATRTPLDDGEESKDTTPLNQSEIGDRAVEDDEESDQGQRDDEIYHGPPTTLLAELQLRKQQAKQRTRPVIQAYPNGTHSTLLQLDAVAQVQAKTRQKKRTILAWEDPDNIEQVVAEQDDDDVPLAMLYSKKAQIQDVNRPMGLMERREMEDNEPLSQRRNRLQGRPAVAPRATTMVNISGYVPPEQEGETLAQRVRRLKEAGGTATGLPADSGLPVARPISGDFATEMMSQFGGELLDKGKGKEISSPPPEEEETMGQRRKRLQAEREARAKEVGTLQAEAPPQQRSDNKAKRSMADLLSAHPSAGAERAVSYEKPVGGLLGLHEKHTARRASTLLNFDTSNIPGPAQQSATTGEKSGFRNGAAYIDGQGGMISSSTAPAVQLPPPQGFNTLNSGAIPFAQPTLGSYSHANMNAYGAGNAYTSQQMMMPFANPYAMGMGYAQGPAMGMQMGYIPGMGMQMGHPAAPLNQGQIDMVERWRQSVMQ